MRKLFIPIVLSSVLLMSACGSGEKNDAASPSASSAESSTAAPSESPSASATASSDTIIYQSESGPVEVPANPQRVVVLTRFLTGNVMILGVPLVGVDEMSKDNPNFAEQLKDAAVVSEDNPERILELNPDLIIADVDNKNLDKMKEIAPTVAYTYGKVDFKQQEIEIGKLLNKEKEARAWVEDFDARSKKAGEEIKAKIGADATVSVIETFNKQLYVYGDNYGRGSEILYQQFGLKMPEKVLEGTKTAGYVALSTEVLGDYMGDYVIFSKDADQDNSFQDTATYKNLPSVKNGHVYEANEKAFYFNDPMSMEYQLEFFIQHFLG
ncbi:iron-hydroxamate ABC transporter substrate-binding protein [Cohnella sp. AR92]|uniref:iron-hydroxamate ABC transporter substrate-binding protein n=1 Tax=Cohnella sp. AR92 TaxID=648716 RepID=UPI000F8DDB02|nr:iron-hydroxamate ABC transporter substrate-binding protein [Cohnella sp. AR92]RUS46239.1 iron-hydroxamate ABC transporter substrate-binding protein [Cohnella sp. AR92]